MMGFCGTGQPETVRDESLTDNKFKRHGSHTTAIARPGGMFVDVMLKSAATGHAAITGARFIAQLTKIPNPLGYNHANQFIFGHLHAGAHEAADALGTGGQIAGGFHHCGNRGQESNSVSNRQDLLRLYLIKLLQSYPLFGVCQGVREKIGKSRQLMD